MAISKLNVGIIGCGLIGKKRAAAVNNYDGTEVVALCDRNLASLEAAEAGKHVMRCQDWKGLESLCDLDIIIVSTPNAFLGEIAGYFLGHGKHVLIEKPMCRNVEEANRLKVVADKSSALLKIGFNHRYHPAIKKAKSCIESGLIGTIINARIVYGHGGRPGYENEWRGSKFLAGGGELTDQGVHVADLLQWFFGMPKQVYSSTQKGVWQLEGDLEDNAFGLFKYSSGLTVLMHTSWTQWKNKFQFEIFGTKGSIEVQGLGGSYGQETLIINIRNQLGGIPQVINYVYEEKDNSWCLEWEDFMRGIEAGAAYYGTPSDGIKSMKIIEAMYCSSKLNKPIEIYES